MLCFCLEIITALITLYACAIWLLRKIRIADYGSRFVLITGCDTGFGHDLALRLDKKRFNVFAACLTQRGADDLMKIASGKLRTILLDVTKEDDIAKALRFVKANLPSGSGLWAVVNNAGICGMACPVEWTARSDYEKTLSVNLYGVIDVTRAFLPLIRKVKGRVVNIASMFGTFAAASTSAYCISKYGVEAFSDSLRREMSVFGVTVHILEPGFFLTNLTDPDIISANFTKAFERCNIEVQRTYGRAYLECVIKEDIQGTLRNKLRNPNTYKVVDALTHAVTALFPKYRYVVGLDGFITVHILRWLPEWFQDRFVISRAGKSRQLLLKKNSR